jgi:hypothetical protein
VIYSIAQITPEKSWCKEALEKLYISINKKTHLRCIQDNICNKYLLVLKITTIKDSIKEKINTKANSYNSINMTSK